MIEISGDEHIPLAVDLDGTLVFTDLLHESLVRLVRNEPFCAWQGIAWLLRGKACLKERLADASEFDPSLLPYNAEFVSFLRAEKAQGRELLLCTGAHEQLAEAVADYLGIFSGVIATRSDRNLTGQAKAEALIAAYGEGGFDYAGNAAIDLAVWRHARRAIVVNAAPPLRKKVAALTVVERVFPSPHRFWTACLKVMRPYQWLKNLLLFAPCIAAHKLDDPHVLPLLAAAFVAFGLCAAAVYTLNDILDAVNDRRHPRKRFRPLAQGSLTVTMGLLLSGIFLTASLLLGVALSGTFAGVLCLYFTTSLAYSVYIKRLILLDCIILTLLYALRIIAGAVIIDVPLSFWMLTFSIFVFLSLAFVKRYAELRFFTSKTAAHHSGRAYRPEDSQIIAIFGIASAYTSVLVLALYLNSSAVCMLYTHPTILWLALPVMTFWLSWVWLCASRGTLSDDPLLFALTDRVSQLSFLAFAATLIAASTF